MMNKLFYGDNLEILKQHISDDSVDLIYIDPPFNSKRDYNIIYEGATAQAQAFRDTWSMIGINEIEELIYEKEAQRYSSLHNVLTGLKEILLKSPNAGDKSMYAYLVNMGIRMVELHKKLKETGNFYLHCDATANYYLRILLDAIFGNNNFRNEIIWHYRRWSNVSKNYQRMHDVIFFYAKSKESFFLIQNQPYSDEKHIENTVRGIVNGKLVRLKDTEGNYLARTKENNGVPLHDVWHDINFVAPTSKERLGYPTQKPKALLERIIKSSCPEKGIVLDAYCGCGTTIAAAKELGIKWIGIDITYLSIDLIQQRLLDSFYLKDSKNATLQEQKKAKEKLLKDVTIFGIPKDLESARKLARETKNDYVRKEFEKWSVFSVGGVYSEKKGSDGGVDGYFYIYDADIKGKVTKKQCYIQVKSGKIGIGDIKHFEATLTSLNSPIGIFVTLEEPTKPILEYTASLPKYKSVMDRVYDRITLITTQNILDEEVPDFAVRATKRAVAFDDSERLTKDLFSDSEE